MNYKFHNLIGLKPPNFDIQQFTMPTANNTEVDG